MDLGRICRVTSESSGTKLILESFELSGISSGKRDLHAVPGE
jgi:hypothetical protein